MAVTTATTRFWHPFADMGSVSQRELVIERGEGVWVYDVEGNRYLDGTASLWYANLGHGREDDRRGGRRADAQDRRLLDVRRLRQPPRPTSSASGWRRSRRWTTRACSSLRRRRRDRHGGEDRPPALGAAAATRSASHLISRTQGYHGTHGFGTSLGGIEANVDQLGSARRRDLDGASTTRCRRSRPRSCASGPTAWPAFFCEPVIGAGGVHPPPEGYIQGVADLCAEHGVLLVDRQRDLRLRPARHLVRDRALGRRPARPDHVRQGRHVGLPAARRRDRVRRRSRRRSSRRPGGPMLRHGATYAGHPTVLRRRARRSWTSTSARTCSRAGASSSSRSRTRWRRSPTTRQSPRCARGCGLLAAVQLAPEVSSRSRRRGQARAGRARRGRAGAAAAWVGRGVAAADRRAGAPASRSPTRSAPAWTASAPPNRAGSELGSPELRAGPPWVTEEMVAAEPALARDAARLAAGGRRRRSPARCVRRTTPACR